MSRLVPAPLSMASASGAGAEQCNSSPGLPRTTVTASSAPQSPREQNELPAGYRGLRKCSFNADLGRDSLSRNGSMAHLLEQQHLLRREFNATPDSVAYSVGSSLSPSIEQVGF